HQGAAIVFFAYIGFDAISTAAEETVNPQRNLPIGILAGLAICTIIYVIVGFVLTGIVPYRELAVADPLARALELSGFTTVSWTVAPRARVLPARRPFPPSRGRCRPARPCPCPPYCSCSSTASRGSSSRWHAMG